ncbi:MAG: hypothetical protein K1X29_06295 [Bdellovibrionales bacterium]|nr:hypothetical protein [Bdellovibrionales bacterium]
MKPKFLNHLRHKNNIMRTGLQTSVELMGILILISCAHQPMKEQKSIENKNAVVVEEWQHKMRSLSTSLSKLLPLVYNQKLFNDPNQYETIEKESKNLATMAHVVNTTIKKTSEDPSLSFVSDKLDTDMKEAVRQLELGNRKFARHLIRNATSYCISCHTHNDQGRQNLNLSLSLDLDHMQPMDRAELHMSLRDFDAALKDYEQIINSPDAQIERFQNIELAAEKTLAIAIRVKGDPDLALKLVETTITAKWSPEYLKLNAMAWKTAVLEWKKEPEIRGFTPKMRLQKAKSLLQQGWKFSANSIQSRAGLVYFLRASVQLHDLLSTKSHKLVYGEALYYAGLTAESLREINLWTLHEAYYESCIRFQPYTTTAKKCYLRMEALQLASYVDGDNGFVPAAVRDHLKVLKSMAVKQDSDFLSTGGIGD